MASVKKAFCSYCYRPFMSRNKGYGKWTKFCSTPCAYKAARKPRVWTEEEYAKLRQLYPMSDRQTVVDNIPSHKLTRIVEKAAELGIRRSAYYRYARGGKRARQFKILNQLNTGYLAALIDGEGSISLNKHKNPLPEVSVVNTCQIVIEWCREITGIGKVYPRKNKKGRPIFTWHISTFEEVIVLLTVLKPHVIIKHQLAENMLVYLESRIKQLKDTYDAKLPPFTDEQLASIAKIRSRF